MIGLPFAAGAVKVTVAPPFPATAVTPVGVPGTETGVTPADGRDAVPVPSTFVAVTVNVYAVPFVNPVTVIGLAVPVAVIPPGLDVTVYCVMGYPPVDAGAVKLTVAVVLPATAETAVGVPGAAKAARGVTL